MRDTSRQREEGGRGRERENALPPATVTVSLPSPPLLQASASLYILEMPAVQHHHQRHGHFTAWQAAMCRLCHASLQANAPPLQSRREQAGHHVLHFLSSSRQWHVHVQQ